MRKYHELPEFSRLRPAAMVIVCGKCGRDDPSGNPGRQLSDPTPEQFALERYLETPYCELFVRRFTQSSILRTLLRASCVR